jgi:hypothetical protein
MDLTQDTNGNLTLTFPTGTVRTIPAKQVLLKERWKRCEHAADLARRAVLVTEPDCGKACGANYDQCGCLRCAEYQGYFEEGEKEAFFTDLQRQQINSCWDEKTGFLGETGCRLPRSLRAMACLRNICIYDTGLEKYKTIYQLGSADGRAENKTPIL